MPEKLTDSEIASRTHFAIDQCSERNAIVDRMVELYQQDFPDVKTIEPSPGSSGGVEFNQIVKPGRADAIISKYISYTIQTSDIGLEVLPLKSGEGKGETDLCSGAEDFLRGLIDETNYYSNSPWMQGACWWYYAGGMGTVKTVFNRALLGTDEFPIEFTTPDTREVYPVFYREQLLYVVERYKRYVISIRNEIETVRENQKGKGGKRWAMPKLLGENGDKLGDMDEVWVEEYWDKKHKALRVNSENVYNEANDYPCIPYAIRGCKTTPLNDFEWKFPPILLTSENALKQEAYIMTLLLKGLEYGYWPLFLYQNADGKMETFQVGAGAVQAMDSETKVTVINPQPSTQLAENMLRHFVDEIQRNTLPGILWMQPASPARSGYAEEIRFAGTEADLRYLANGFSALLAHAFSNVLKITEQFAELAKGGELSVYSPVEGRTRRELISIGKKDIAGHYKVRVDIQPRMPKDMLQEMQLARFSREQSAVTGEQLLPDTHILREVFRVQNPTLIEKQRRMELARGDPRIQAYIKDQAIKDFRKAEGISDKEWARYESPPAQVAPKVQLPIPPPGLDQMMAGAPDEGMMQAGMAGAGPGSTPWGIDNAIMPSEEGGMGRAQQLSPGELASLAGRIIGRPNEGEGE